MDSKNSSLKKTIKITEALHEELLTYGGKGDTFDVIISRIIATNKLLSKDKDADMRLAKNRESQTDYESSL